MAAHDRIRLTGLPEPGPALVAGPPPHPRDGGSPDLPGLPGASFVSVKMRERRQDVFSAVIRRAGDGRLDRLLGPRGLRVLFGEMVRRFEPEAAQGFAGDILYELEAADGAVHRWTVTIAGDRARARPGTSEDPTVRLRTSVTDFARIAAGELDAGEALLEGRLDVFGDVAVAARLGEMFGQPGLVAR